MPMPGRFDCGDTKEPSLREEMTTAENLSAEKRIIVVLGMHRSGTSAITRGLKALGVSLGEHLLEPATDNNEKGFWEDRNVNSLNIALLKELGHDWQTLAPIMREELESDKARTFMMPAVELLRARLGDNPVF